MTKEETINYLIDNGISISFAESCTGGSLAAALTKVPGVSKIFKGSIVTYSIEHKEKYLDVKDETIKKFGVVSEEVALEMVLGLKNKVQADVCISVTGNCGPSLCDENKQAGTAFVAYYKDEPSVTKVSLNSTRELNIETIVSYVFEVLIPSKLIYRH